MRSCRWLNLANRPTADLHVRVGSEPTGSIESTAPAQRASSACVIALRQIFHDNMLGRAAFLPSPRGSDVWSTFMGMMYFEDLNVGDSWTSAEYTVDHEETMVAQTTRGHFTLIQRQPPDRRLAD
jgi:hypothetical protein